MYDRSLTITHFYWFTPTWVIYNSSEPMSRYSWCKLKPKRTRI